MAAAVRWLAAAAGVSAAAAATYQNPVVRHDAPDPGVFFDAASDQYVAVSTAANDPSAAFPLWTSPDLATWASAGQTFAANGRPAWAASDFWAPEVHLVGGNYTLYFTARNAKGVLSVGVAKSTSGSVLGPYEDALGHPLLENPSPPGTIDATFFKDPASGDQFLIWKLDGNDVGRPTPILMARLNEDGTALLDEPAELIRNDQEWEGCLVEAPWMYVHGGRYYLFYSGNIYGSYGIGVAHSASPRGPFEKLKTPVVHTDSSVTKPDWIGPGHCSVVDARDGSTAVLYHAWAWAEQVSFADPRFMMLEKITWTPDAVALPQVAGGVPSSGEQPLPLAQTVSI